MDTTPELLALDWGTSSLRAFLMRAGRVLESRHAPHGIQHLPAAGRAGFEQAFAGVAASWLQRWPALPVVAGGMVGSAQGWLEAPYVRCPAGVHGLAAGAVRVAIGLGPPVVIAPGMLLDAAGALPDVMRGEELQVAGALLQQPAWGRQACFVLPGSHSKWVQVQDGQVSTFTTCMTGELFAVLRRHSILGRLMPDTAQAGFDAAAFTLGLDTARASRGAWLQELFAARTLGLAGRLPAAALADYLSGLLIGHELACGLQALAGAAAQPLVLVGEPMLCERYAAALRHAGRPADAALDNTAPAGLWQFAGAAGLLPAS